MRNPLWCLAIAMTLSLPVMADDLRGSDRFLCTSAETTACVEGDACFVVSPTELNVPRFVAVDLEKKTLSTTGASPAARTTPILQVIREDGAVFLQGVQVGRGFSIVVDEATGFMSAAIATDGVVVAVFGACTPLPVTTAGD